MNALRRCAAIAAASVLAAGCSTADLQNLNVNQVLDTANRLSQSTQEPTEQQEAEIGRQWAATLTGAAPLVHYVEVERYVNRVGMWVAMQSERPNLPWRFGVLDDADINAFAAPGGYVFITRGLLQHMHSEAELAGVLGHEISHVVRKHQLRAVQRATGMSDLADIVSQHVQTPTGVSGVVSDRLLSGFKEVMSRGLDRSDELEADRMGVVLAARAGYNPYGLPAVLQMLQSLNPQDASLALMFATHPAPTARLDALDQVMDQRFDIYTAQAENIDRFRNVMRQFSLPTTTARPRKTT
jgi:predicted Zn-dependent protease